MCVVVRYFGGVKLGAGGLIRAYGAAAREVLRDAPVQVLIPMSDMRVTVPGAQISAIYEVVSKAAGSCSTSDEDYRADGSASVTIKCESDQKEAIKSKLRDATRGGVTFEADG